MAIPRKIDAVSIRNLLFEILPMLGRALILDDRFYQDKSDPYRQFFADNPDDPMMHESDWHEWGIITHSLNIDFDVVWLSTLLGDVFDPTASKLRSQKVGTLSRWDLCMIVEPALHDIGKFTRRHFHGLKPDGVRLDFGFKGHEVGSGEIIQHLRHFLTGFGLSYGQVDYLARLASLHFKLGQFRKIAKKTSGFNFVFIKSPECERACLDIIRENPDMAEEIGAFFVADSLAKVSNQKAVWAKSEEELESLQPVIEKELVSKGIPERYIVSSLELAPEIALARRYFEVLNEFRKTTV